MPESKAIVRPDLGAIAYEFSRGASSAGYIAQRVLPVFYTPERSAQYPYIPADALLEVVNTKRAPRAAYARSDWQFDWKDYSCKENGYEEPVDDSEAKQFANYFDAETVAVERAMGIVLRSMEVRTAAKVFSTSIFTPHAVTHAWTDYASADPRGDILAGRKELRQTTGLKPNALILDEDLILHVSMCDSVIERVKYTNPNAIRGSLTLEQLQAYFEVEQIITAGAVYNKAAKRKPKDIDGIWDPTKAMLCVVSSGGQDLKEPSLGRTFSWQEDAPETLVVEQYREDQTRSDIYRVRQNTDECLQFTAAGYLLTGLSAE